MLWELDWPPLRPLGLQQPSYYCIASLDFCITKRLKIVRSSKYLPQSHHRQPQVSLIKPITILVYRFLDPSVTALHRWEIGLKKTIYCRGTSTIGCLLFHEIQRCFGEQLLWKREDLSDISYQIHEYQHLKGGLASFLVLVSNFITLHIVQKWLQIITRVKVRHSNSLTSYFHWTNQVPTSIHQRTKRGLWRTAWKPLLIMLVNLQI
jgi:hypothetical protein